MWLGAIGEEIHGGEPPRGAPRHPAPQLVKQFLVLLQGSLVHRGGDGEITCSATQIASTHDGAIHERPQMSCILWE